MSRPQISTLVLILALIGAFDALAQDADVNSELGMEVLSESLPALTLVTGRGERRNSADWQHKLVVLHFWASWCKPCRKELPELAALANKLDPGRGEVVLVSIDEDKSGDELTRYAHALGVELPIYIAKLSEVPAAFWTWGVPATYIINGKTRQLGRCLGPREWSRLTDSLLAMAQP